MQKDKKHSLDISVRSFVTAPIMLLVPMVATYALTLLIPIGSYQQQMQVGQQVMVADTYHQVAGGAALLEVTAVAAFRVDGSRRWHHFGYHCLSAHRGRHLPHPRPGRDHVLYAEKDRVALPRAGSTHCCAVSPCFLWRWGHWWAALRNVCRWCLSLWHWRCQWWG